MDLDDSYRPPRSYKSPRFRAEEAKRLRKQKRDLHRMLSYVLGLLIAGGFLFMYYYNTVL